MYDSPKSKFLQLKIQNCDPEKSKVTCAGEKERQKYFKTREISIKSLINFVDYENVEPG